MDKINSKNMKYFRVFFAGMLLLLLSASTTFAFSESFRVEAEKMELSNYEVGGNNDLSYIQLTAETGIASFSFEFPSGRYTINARYLSESPGQNTYTLYIGNNQIVAWLGKNRDDQWHMLGEQVWHFPKNIEIKKGEEIRIETLSENGTRAVLDYLEFTPFSRESASSEENLITIFPEEYPLAIKNPLKGFRASGPEHEYSTLMKSYIKWNEIENSAEDGIDKIITFCDNKWEGLEKKNIKVIPRVYLAWSGNKNYWPSDMTTGDFTSEQFKNRVIALIKKLGQAWDNDPRVAFVEMGLIGEWGEMEWPDTKDEIKSAIAAQFTASFQNKLVMIRWPNTYKDDIYNFGYYWDSFAHIDQEYYAFHLNNTSPKWKTAPIGGETAYNWGSVHIQPGKNPNESLSTPLHRDYVIDRLRKLHANHVGWIANYNHDDEKVREGAELVQKVLGYRFVISEVSYPKRIYNVDEFTVSFKVKNTGSSPFYYNWPVEVSLLDPETKRPVWKKNCKDLDIRNWLPGDKWNDSTDRYEISPENYLINQTFEIKGIPDGEYILALSILDPGGNLPSARFAIKNYLNGGRHPIAIIDLKNNECALLPADFHFDNPALDNSLHYSKNY